MTMVQQVNCMVKRSFSPSDTLSNVTRILSMGEQGYLSVALRTLNDEPSYAFSLRFAFGTAPWHYKLNAGALTPTAMRLST